MLDVDRVSIKRGLIEGTNQHSTPFIVVGGHGAGAWENRVREGYERRERKGWDVGEKWEMLFFYSTMH